VSSEVVTTYDIFPTILRLAGAPLPSDRRIDGADMLPLLTGAAARSAHECLYFWKGEPGGGCPKAHPGCPGLWAVRCGAYKLHWVTTDSVGPRRFEPQFHSPPLLFQLEQDPSEAHPIDPAAAEYAAARATIEAAAKAHRESVTPVPNQIGRGEDGKLKLCCDWASKEKHPDLPQCTCNPEAYRAFVCAPVGPAGGALAAVSADGAVVRIGLLDPRDAATWPASAAAAAPFWEA